MNKNQQAQRTFTVAYRHKATSSCSLLPVSKIPCVPLTVITPWLTLPVKIAYTITEGGERQIKSSGPNADRTWASRSINKCTTTEHDSQSLHVVVSKSNQRNADWRSLEQSLLLSDSDRECSRHEHDLTILLTGTYTGASFTASFGHTAGFSMVPLN